MSPALIDEIFRTGEIKVLSNSTFVLFACSNLANWMFERVKSNMSTSGTHISSKTPLFRPSGSPDLQRRGIEVGSLASAGLRFLRSLIKPTLSER
jgi:hypothetical protein